MISRFARSYVVLRRLGDPQETDRQMAHQSMMGSIPSMAVTAFMTQYDEQRQIEEFVSGIERPSTAAMVSGTEVHAELERQAKFKEIFPRVGDGPLGEVNFDVAGMPIAVFAKNEIRFMDYLNKIHALSNKQMVRELPVYGRIANFALRGIIDGVSPGNLVITETKTTSRLPVNPSLVHLAYHQTLIYHVMLQSLVEAGTNSLESLMDSFWIEHEVIRSLVNHPVSKTITEAHQGLMMSNKLYIDVIHNNLMHRFETVFDREIYEQMVQSRLDLFNGKRMPFGCTLRHILE